ncbi:MAG: DNA-directed RNA polymerase subunit delta [Clostridium sp.]|nr:DNA-directed RNA polymerase subunit delta [Clostridium sp.]MCM1444535.1 DNA-directed RNA polymerase subunit delta [Candidatus Amulumruptor caecigallinarius]
MNLNNITKEEIESLSYTDLTYMILSEEKKSLTTAEAFKKICSLLDYTDSQYAEKIGDYYTSLTIDKRFVMLEDAKWDLRKNHAIETDMIEEDEEIEEEVSEEDEEVEEIEEDLDAVETDEIDIDDDDLDDLTVLSDDEEELEDEN